MPPIITALFALCSLSRQTLAHCPQSVCFLCSVYLNTSIVHPPHLHIWQPVVCICFEGQSLCLGSDLIRCTDVCPALSPAATPSTPFARFIFHARSRRPCPPTPACPPYHSIALCTLVSSRRKIYSVLPKQRTRLCFQAPMTVTDMYIMLSDSVRHATALPLFIWKLFITTGPCVAGDLLWLFRVAWLSFRRCWHAAAHE